MSGIQPVLSNLQFKSENEVSKYAIEFLKCKRNPLYFIYNYVYIPEIGNRLKYTPERMHTKFLRAVKILYNLHYCILMASRQLGKSTIAAALIEWACNFYPGNRAIIINMEKKYAYENLDKIKFIHENLPDFLKIPITSKGRKSYVDYAHGSKIQAFFYSTTAKPETVARSLTAPILYIDEGAHIRHIDKIYFSAQPVLSTAVKQAIKNKYPYFIFITSTPNGVEGDGRWFYEMWSNGIDSDEIFDENNKLKIKDNKELYNMFPDKNAFCKVKFHWSEDPLKNEDWYNEQKRQLNFDKRRINQELDLKFLGSTTCIFDDEFISSLTPKKPIRYIRLVDEFKLKLFKEFENDNYYVIGIDTAKSLLGDKCAIEIYDYKNFEQIGEFNGRLGSVSLYIEGIRNLLQYIESKIGRRFILAIENNSVGNQVVEDLEDDYEDQIFSPDERYTGINTNSKTKKLMLSILYDKFINDPNCIKSEDLISQINVIERKSNGSVGAMSGYNDDLFMASAFCAYCYEYTYEDIVHFLNVKDINKQIEQDYKQTINCAIIDRFSNDSKNNILKEIYFTSEEELEEDLSSEISYDKLYMPLI